MVETKEEKIELRFTAQVGCLVKGSYVNAIKKFCFENNFDCLIEEGDGILSKLLYIRIFAPENRERKVIDFMESMSE